jgi:hypothetical protein
MSIRGERSLSEVLQDVVGNIQEIIRSEFQLAKAEIKDRVAKMHGPAAWMGVGSVIFLYGLGFILLAIVYKLGTIMEPWLAALLVGGVLALFAAVILISATSKLRRIDAVPQRTVKTMKENMTWAKKQIK